MEILEQKKWKKTKLMPEFLLNHSIIFLLRPFVSASELHPLSLKIVIFFLLENKNW